MTASATIYEVAAAANVSVRTVSRYLNDPTCVSAKTSALIVSAMQTLKYRPSIAARSCEDQPDRRGLGSHHHQPGLL
jgi:LacI family transcriptional regulator